MSSSVTRGCRLLTVILVPSRGLKVGCIKNTSELEAGVYVSKMGITVSHSNLSMMNFYSTFREPGVFTVKLYRFNSLKSLVSSGFARLLSTCCIVNSGFSKYCLIYRVGVSNYRINCD